MALLSVERAPYLVGFGVWTVLGALGRYTLWMLLMVVFFQLSPPLASGWLILWAALFAWRCLSPGAGTPYVGEQRPGPAWAWLLRIVLILLVFDVAFVTLYLDLFSLPHHEHGALEEYAQQPWGSIPFALVVGLLGPMLEEATCRGWIQGRLEERTGAGIALTTSTLLFALMHLNASLLGYYLVWGLILGYAVHRTRSLWTGILLHSIPNLAAVAEHLGLLGDLLNRIAPAHPAASLAYLIITAVSAWLLFCLLRAGPQQRPAPA